MFFRSLEGANNAVTRREVYQDGVHYTCNFSYKMEDKLKTNHNQGDQGYSSHNSNYNNNGGHQGGGRRYNGNNRSNYNSGSNRNRDGNYQETERAPMDGPYGNAGSSSAPPAIPFMIPVNMMNPYPTDSQATIQNNLQMMYPPAMTSSAVYYSPQPQITDYQPQQGGGMQYTPQPNVNMSNIQNPQHRPSPPPLAFHPSFPIPPPPPPQVFYQGHSYPPSLHHSVVYQQQHPQQPQQVQNPNVAPQHHHHHQHQIYSSASFSSSSQGGYAPHYPPSPTTTYSASSGQTTSYPFPQLNYGASQAPYQNHQQQQLIFPHNNSTAGYPTISSISSSSSLTSPRSLNGNSTHSNHSNYSNTSKK
jgi:hypothetical protein